MAGSKTLSLAAPFGEAVSTDGRSAPSWTTGGGCRRDPSPTRFGTQPTIPPLEFGFDPWVSPFRSVPVGRVVDRPSVRDRIRAGSVAIGATGAGSKAPPGDPTADDRRRRADRTSTTAEGACQRRLDATERRVLSHERTWLPLRRGGRPRGQPRALERRRDADWTGRLAGRPRRLTACSSSRRRRRGTRR